MNSSPERKGVASDEDAQAQLRLQYAGLHSNEKYPDDQSFSRLLQETSVSRVKEYLDGLTEAYSRGEEHPTAFRNEIWHAFLLRKPRAWSTMRSIYKLEEDDDLGKEFIELAFFHQYPRWAQKEDVPNKQMLEALLAGSLAAGEEFLAAIEPEPKYIQILKAGYRHPYLRHESISQPILKRLSEAAEKWSQGEYLAPYTTLFGPSLVGKTRLLQQLSKNICVIYIGLGPPNSTGLSSWSPLANEMVPAAKKSFELELEYTRFLAAVFHVVAEFFSKQPAQISEERRLKKWFKFNSEFEDEFASRVCQRMREVSNAKLDDRAVLRTSLKKMHESTCFIQNPHLKVLLAIDEARILAELKTRNILEESYFHIFREVLSTIPSSLGFFAVFTDIPLTVADPDQTLFEDPTGRPSGSRIKELFAPIYDIGTFDSKVPPDRPKTWAELLSPRRLFSYGLPFFRIYVEGAEDKGMTGHMIVRNVGQIATQKLLGDTRPPEPLSEAQVFALLGSTIQPRTDSATKLNTDLISKHLAQCLYISPSRDRVISEYPSQFACSMAANYFLATDESRLIYCIKALTVALQQGVISSGNAGELASRIILVRAMHKTMSISEGQIEYMQYGNSVRLVDFLCTLTGLGEKDLDLGDIEPQHKKRLLTEGRLFWNHFVQITYTPHASDFLEFMYRGMAVQCMPMQPGFDQLFTVYFDSGDPNSVLTKDRISFCGVRAKNEEFNFEREAPEWTDENADIKINPKNAYLFILFSFKTQSTQQQPLPKIPNRGSLIFHGLTDIKCLTAGISEALDELLAIEDDVRSFHKDRQMTNFMETARPVVYPRQPH